LVFLLHAEHPKKEHAMLETPTEQMREGEKMEWTKKGRLGIDAIKETKRPQNYNRLGLGWVAGWYAKKENTGTTNRHPSNTTDERSQTKPSF
jgi:hypothetical protein